MANESGRWQMGTRLRSGRWRRWRGGPPILAGRRARRVGWSVFQWLTAVNRAGRRVCLSVLECRQYGASLWTALIHGRESERFLTDEYSSYLLP